MTFVVVFSVTSLFPEMSEKGAIDVSSISHVSDDMTVSQNLEYVKITDTIR